MAHSVHFEDFDDYSNEDDNYQSYYPESVEDLMDQLSYSNEDVNNAEFHKILATFMKSKEEKKQKQRKKKTVTVSVQTECDVSRIPPSWIVSGEKLVKELRIGLTNIINTLYHSPAVSHLLPGAHGYCASSNLIRHPRLAFPESALGEYASLDGPPRFPSSLERIISSEDFRKKLHSLKDTAERLGWIISYLNGCMPAESGRSDKETFKEMKSTYQQTEPEMMHEYDHGQQDVRRVTCCPKTDFTAKFSNLKIDFKASGHVEETTKKKQLPEWHDPPKYDYHNQKSDVSKISKSCESINNLPRAVPKLKTQRSVQEPIERYSAAAVRDGTSHNQQKIVKTSSQDKNAASGSSSKNFIKRNILALKSQSDAASSSKSTSHNTQRSLPTQKQRDKKK